MDPPRHIWIGEVISRKPEEIPHRFSVVLLRREVRKRGHVNGGTRDNVYWRGVELMIFNRNYYNWNRL
jgi:hypothetical protein